MTDNRSSVKEIQMVSAKILRDLAEIFEKNNLRYVVCFGSLLGAIRHNGFIPWDDDLDIAMPREDFERFKKMARDELPDYLFFQDYSTDVEYPSHTAKVRNINTTMIENGYRNLRKMNHGIFVDVFVGDYYTPGKINRLKLKLVRLIKGILIAQKVCTASKIKKNVAKLFPRNAMFRKSEKMLRSLDKKNKKQHYMVDGAYLCDADMFDDTVLVSFEDFEVRVPRKYDEILRGMYGDYMQFPPEEQRRPLHMTEHISCEIPFARYLEEHEVL